MSGLSVYTYLKPSQVFSCLGRLLCFWGRSDGHVSLIEFNMNELINRRAGAKKNDD